MKKNQIVQFTSFLLMSFLFASSLTLPLFAQADIKPPSSEGVIEDILITEEGKEEAKRPELSTEQYTSLVMLMMDYVRRFYVDEVDANTLFEGAMKGLFESLGDPYSQYLTFDEMEMLKNTTVGDFAGIGIYHQKQDPKLLTMESDIKDGYIYVVAPIDGSPAYKAGVQAGDYIIKIDGESVIPMTSEDIVNKLKGQKGEPVIITILRGKELTFDLEVIRDNITIPTVRYAMIPDHIGYIKISQFTPHTAEDVQEALEGLLEEGMKALILDVRMNPGGVFNSAIRIADLFFSEGDIVSTKSRIRRDNVSYEATPGVLVPETLPVVALINKGSASASEVLVGALKDRGRAFVIGEQSFGKGVVQNVIPGYLGTGFKLTTARYYTPNGISIDKTGIEPDLVIEMPEMEEGEEESYRIMLEEKVLDNFVKENPQADVEDIKKFMSDLKAEGYSFDENLIGQALVSLIYQERGEVQPVYKIDFDIVLQEAVNKLNDN